MPICMPVWFKSLRLGIATASLVAIRRSPQPNKGVAADELVGLPSASFWRSQLNASIVARLNCFIALYGKAHGGLPHDREAPFAEPMMIASSTGKCFEHRRGLRA
jgi:hypothetical protein